MKKIFPIDWKKMHPGHAPMSTDFYYTQLANKVLRVLVDDGFGEILEEADRARDTAVRLTAWFEDLCNGGRLWGVVNDVCNERHGKPLPFYDTSKYNPGEPNLQDIMLLLWDIIQSQFDDRVINPENPALMMAAMHLYDIFDEEYETAPETDEMIAFLNNPALGSDYWQARKAMEWFALGSYLSLRANIHFDNEVSNITDDEDKDVIIYHLLLSHAFNDTHNLLALTASEWLSKAYGHRMELDKTMTKSRLYDIVALHGDTVLVRDSLNGKEVSLETESFDPEWAKRHLSSAKQILCNIIGFNGKYYQFWAMMTNPGEKVVSDYRERRAQEETERDNVKYTAEMFEKASEGKPVVFVKGVDEYMDFQTKKMGSKVSDDFRRETERYLREDAEDGMVALMRSDEAGLLSIMSGIPAIKAPNNPYYDEAYARDNALIFIVDPHIIDYSSLCTLISHNYLPDAAVNSLQGYEHGRDLVQQNIQFLADYYFAQHNTSTRNSSQNAKINSK